MVLAGWIARCRAIHRQPYASQSRSMSRTAVNDLVAVCAGVFGVALYAGLILAPAWTSYSRLWERVAASILSLYVLAVLVGIGVAGALAVIYFWG